LSRGEKVLDLGPALSTGKKGSDVPYSEDKESVFCSILLIAWPLRCDVVAIRF
jgi:hypothetical protein